MNKPYQLNPLSTKTGKGSFMNRVEQVSPSYRLSSLWWSIRRQRLGPKIINLLWFDSFWWHLSYMLEYDILYWYTPRKTKLLYNIASDNFKYSMSKNFYNVRQVQHHWHRKLVEFLINFNSFKVAYFCWQIAAFKLSMLLCWMIPHNNLYRKIRQVYAYSMVSLCATSCANTLNS